MTSENGGTKSSKSWLLFAKRAVSPERKNWILRHRLHLPVGNEVIRSHFQFHSVLSDCPPPIDSSRENIKLLINPSKQDNMEQTKNLSKEQAHSLWNNQSLGIAASGSTTRNNFWMPRVIHSLTFKKNLGFVSQQTPIKYAGTPKRMMPMANSEKEYAQMTTIMTQTMRMT